MKPALPLLPVNQNVLDAAAAVAEDALAICRIRGRSTWASLAWSLDDSIDPLQCFAEHKHTRRRLLWREHDWQLALGISATTRHSGASRFVGCAEDASEWRNRICFKRCDENAPDLPFFIDASFEDQAPLDSHWGSSLAGCRMIMPQRLLWQQGQNTWCYAVCEVFPNDEIDHIVHQLTSAVPPRPYLEPKPWPTLASPSFTDIVEEAVALLQTASMRKIVLARAVDEKLAQAKPIEDIIRDLHQAADDRSTCYAYDLDDGSCFVGASPEMLFTLDQQLCSAMALAGTRPRGKDALDDQALGMELMNSTKERKEHQLVVEHLAEILRSRGGVLEIPNCPEIRRLQKIQHLETDLSCQLPEANAFDLLSAIHPTPAVCGLPVSAAKQFIKRHEQLHRGLYTGAIGFHTPDHCRFIVPLRGGIIRGQEARLFAGAGLVETSDPQAEHEETETKLRLMRQVIQA